MSMRLTFIFLISFGFAFTPALAQKAGDDEPDIQRAKLKFRLGGEQNNAQPFQTPEPEPLMVANPLGLAYVPLPRYKPGTPSYQPPVRPRPPESVVEANQRGEVSIIPERLQRERNQKTARDLSPTEKTSWSSAQITAAVKRRELVLATTNIDAKKLAPIGGAGGCGIAAPLLVSSYGAIKVKPPATLNANLSLVTYKWLTEAAQPLARDRYKSSIVSIRLYTSYACRGRRGSGSKRISEHAFGNAMDVASFTLANGQTISIGKEWSATGALFGIVKSASFLADLHKSACKYFATVLGPAYNKAHENHFHIDMGRGGRYKICK